MQYGEDYFAKRNTKTMVARTGKKLGNRKGFAKVCIALVLFCFYYDLLYNIKCSFLHHHI